MIIQNAVKIKETGEIIKSAHRHDYVSRTLKNGKEIVRDGGGSYIRGSIDDPADIEDYTLLKEDKFSKIKKYLLWGTYGKDGSELLRYVPLCKCETAHLKAILKTQEPAPIYIKVIKAILKERAGKVKKTTKKS